MVWLILGNQKRSDAVMRKRWRLAFAALLTTLAVSATTLQSASAALPGEGNSWEEPESRARTDQTAAFASNSQTGQTLEMWVDVRHNGWLWYRLGGNLHSIYVGHPGEAEYLQGYPAVSEYGRGFVYTYRDNHSRIHVTYSNPAASNPLEPLPTHTVTIPNQATRMSPAVITRINGAFGVAYVGIDHQIYFTWPSGRTEWTVERLGGLTDNPVAIAYYQGNPVVAHLGRDRNIWWSQRIQGRWRQWQRVPSTNLPEPINRFVPPALGAAPIGARQTGLILAANGANTNRIMETRFDGVVGAGGHWRSWTLESTGRRLLAGTGPAIYTLYNAARAYRAYLAIIGIDTRVERKPFGPG
jgi:hypothetical protein